MQTVILIIHVFAAIAIIILVLLQHGKGADAGAAFGSGSANTMFGSAGSMSFFMKLTTILAAVFFATSLTLSYIASHQQPPSVRILDNLTPVTPAPEPVQTQPAQSSAPGK